MCWFVEFCGWILICEFGNRLKLEEMLFGLRNGWEPADSYRCLLMGIRLQMLCPISIGDINHHGRRLGAMTTRAISVKLTFSPMGENEESTACARITEFVHLLMKSTYADPGPDDATATRSRSCYAFMILRPPQQYDERDDSLTLLWWRWQTSIAKHCSSIPHMQEADRPEFRFQTSIHLQVPTLNIVAHLGHTRYSSSFKTMRAIGRVRGGRSSCGKLAPVFPLFVNCPLLEQRR